MDKVNNNYHDDVGTRVIGRKGWRSARSLSERAKFVTRIALFVCGTIFFIYVLLNLFSREIEVKPGQSFCFLLAFGAASALIICSANSDWISSAFWLSLALVGQAATLQMIEAGRLIHFQHYPPPHVLMDSHPVLMSIFATQAIGVCLGFLNKCTPLLRWVSGRLKFWQGVVLMLAFVASSAALSKNLAAYLMELSFATAVQLTGLGNIILFAWAIPERGGDVFSGLKERLFASGKGPETLTKRVNRFVFMTALAVVVIAATLSLFVYERHPHVPDEVLYIYQSLYLQQGMLTVPAPSVPEAFSVYMIPYQAARWYSPFPPGWPMLLALGQLIGAAWLINPLLGGLNICLAYLFLKEIYSLRTAVIAVCLLAVSPWNTFLSMSLMSHTLTLTCLLMGAVGVCYARKGKRPLLWSLMAGLSIGFLSFTRPLDGAVVTVLLGLWALGVGGRRIKTKGIVALAGGLAVFGVASLTYNRMITGSALLTPLQLYYEQYFGPKKFALGFGPDRGFDWPLDAMPGHSPLEAMINAVLNIFSLNIELLGWCTGSLLLLGIFVLLGKKERSDYLMLILIAAIAAAYSLFWYHGGPDFGPRYWFLMIVPLTALSARGVDHLGRGVGRLRESPGLPSSRVYFAVAALCSLTLICYLPWRATDKYYRYLNMSPGVATLARKFQFGKSLVLVRGEEHPDYESAWVENPFDSAADVPLYVHDKNPSVRDRVLKAYPDRPVWVLEGPTLTKDGYKVVGGPFSAKEFLSSGD